jgi:hypothetical protein
MLKILIGLSLVLLFVGCGSKNLKYDYTIHKPKVRFSKPSYGALDRMLKETNGKPYIWAEEGKDAFDCSGLVYYCYGSMNMWLPRRSMEQARVGKRVAVKDLRFGDLIFFGKYNRRSRVTHVGIYIGNGYFRHASSAKEGVITSKVSQPYYRKRITVCRRVIASSGKMRGKVSYPLFKVKKKYKKSQKKKIKRKISKKTKKRDKSMDKTIAMF